MKQAKLILNEVRKALGMEVKLEQMKLVDGMTIVEADAFEAGMEIFIITEDEQKIALPIGSYEMENGFVLVVEEEGIIASYMEAPAQEEEAPEVEPEAEVEVEAQAEQPVKKTVESIVKETFFSEIEALKQENIELKAQLEKLSEQPKEEVLEVELAEEPKPISFNPENESPSVNFKFGQNRPMSTLDRVMSKINS
jgi:hypothetical protein